MTEAVGRKEEVEQQMNLLEGIVEGIAIQASEVCSHEGREKKSSGCDGYKAERGRRH